MDPGLRRESELSLVKKLFGVSWELWRADDPFAVVFDHWADDLDARLWHCFAGTPGMRD
jgi:hypothetical protein